jgi:two-component system, sporulation sensor kinase B
MNVIKDFLLQLMFIAIPMFTFHTFFAEKLKDQKNERLVKTALWALSIMLCMSFPTIIGHGQSFDLRLIPLLLGTLYCGIGAGTFLFFLVILYRLYFGIDLGFYHSILNLLCSTPFIWFYVNSFQRAKKEKRVKIAVLLSCYYSLVVVAWYFILRHSSLQNLKVVVIFLAIAVIATWFFITLNENLRDIEQLRLEIQKAEKLRVLSDLTSSFAHEIRNPMQVNRGFLQLMEKESIPHHVKGYIDLCIKEMDRANEIITDYLSFAKPQVENMKSIEVSKQLNQVKNILSPYSLSNGVDLKMNLEDNIFVSADPQKFNQCFINLIKNGIEAMPSGGVVTISCFQQDEQVLIDIVDQGIGMTQEQITNLGTPFYTLKDKGTGLGLMVTYRLIQSFKGSVHVKSQLGKGTKFSIVFPNNVINN